MDKSSGHIFLSELGVIGLNTQLVEIPSASYTSTLALDSIISPRERMGPNCKPALPIAMPKQPASLVAFARVGHT